MLLKWKFHYSFGRQVYVLHEKFGEVPEIHWFPKGEY